MVGGLLAFSFVECVLSTQIRHSCATDQGLVQTIFGDAPLLSLKGVRSRSYSNEVSFLKVFDGTTTPRPDRCAMAAHGRSTFSLFWGVPGEMIACSLVRFCGLLKKPRLGRGRSCWLTKPDDSDAIVQEAMAKVMEGGHSTQSWPQEKASLMRLECICPFGSESGDHYGY